MEKTEKVVAMIHADEYGERTLEIILPTKRIGFTLDYMGEITWFYADENGWSDSGSRIKGRRLRQALEEILEEEDGEEGGEAS